MMKEVMQSLYDGANEGINQINGSIDDAIFIDPEEDLEYRAAQEAEEELEEENHKIDEMNEKIDNKVEELQEKTDQINQSFDTGVKSAKAKIKEASKSDIATAYRCVRLYQWGNMAKDYIAEHPDWANNLREKLGSFGQSAATRLQTMGITDAVDEDTAEICQRRDMLYGSPDAGIEEQMIPDTDMILQGATAPVLESGLEMALG